MVPKASVRVDGTLRRVFVAAGDRVEERIVKVGEERDGALEIEQGVKVGEKVVTKLGPEVRDGAPIASGAKAEKGS